MTQDHFDVRGDETVVDEAGGNIYDQPEDTSHMRSSDQVNAGVFEGDTDHVDRLDDDDLDDDAVLVDDDVVVTDDSATGDDWR